ncbi:MAG TPA: DUF1579 domain-containing protein [Gemmataceae bacterium]|jgi:hypothetical protein
MSRIALVAVALALFAVTALAEDKKPTAQEQAMMAAWMKHSTPGEFHKKFEPMAGTWTYTAKFWMTPDAPPMEMTGKAVRKLIMDGRFLQDEVVNEGSAMPFKGFGLMGYDNHLNKYVMSWIDSMSTSIMQATGEVSADGKTFTFTHDDYDPMLNKTLKSRDVTRITGPDTCTSEFYRTMPDGKEVKGGEIHFTRAKK